MPQISITNDLALAGLLRVFTPFDSHTLNMAPNETDLDDITLGYSYNSNTSNSSTNDPSGQFGRLYANRYDPKMKLMKGVPPTYAQLNTVLSRSSDVLVTFSPQSTTNPNMWVNDGANPSIYLQSTDLAYASASGTATWLWWHSGSNGSLGISTDQPYIQAIFTVGTLGSGSDFEMPTTDIVSGRGYKLINGPRLTIATEFNY